MHCFVLSALRMRVLFCIICTEERAAGDPGNILLQGQPFFGAVISVAVPTPGYRSSPYKIPFHSAKNGGGMYTPNICGFE